MSGKKSSSGVTKFCSILNYLRNEDEVLHNIIVDLCVSHLLKPKSHGITFLRPNPAGCSALKKMAADDPEEAVRMIHSMVILDHINVAGDPNRHRKVLLFFWLLLSFRLFPCDRIDSM